MTHIDYKAIGVRIATLRQMRGLAVRQATEIAGVSPRTWKKWGSDRPMRMEPFLRSATPSAVDYGFNGHQPQRQGIDNLGNEIGFQVLSLPTGQGLILRW